MADVEGGFEEAQRLRSRLMREHLNRIELLPFAKSLNFFMNGNPDNFYKINFLNYTNEKIPNNNSHHHF